MSDVGLTEFAELDAEELHLVRRGANGFPALLAKAAAEEVQVARGEPSELTPYLRRVRDAAIDPQPKKKPKEAKVKQSKVVKAAQKFARTHGAERLGGSAYIAYREAVSQERQQLRKQLGIGANDGERSRALDGASRPAIRNATRPWKAAPNPRVVLSDVASSRAKSVEVPASIRRATLAQVDRHQQDEAVELGELQGEIDALKSQLAKSRDPLEIERLSWRLTHQQLRLGHRLGEC